MGKSIEGRKYMIEEGFTMSIREDNWKYIAPQSRASPAWLANKDVLLGLLPIPKLYDLNKDPKEENNLALQMPEKVKAMAAQLSQIMKI
jgi:arylsulfatase A-like enzyme